jgi:hypothetical protein
MSNRERAAEHVEKAQEILADKNVMTKNNRAAAAGAHATLALYYQREADRAGEA